MYAQYGACILFIKFRLDLPKRCELKTYTGKYIALLNSEADLGQCQCMKSALSNVHINITQHKQG